MSARMCAHIYAPKLVGALICALLCAPKLVCALKFQEKKQHI